jgi:G3E family GTPase
MVELANGCICCSLSGELADAGTGLLAVADRFDHLVVETTGIADPLPVALTFLRSEFRDAVRLDGVVAVVDAETLNAAHPALDIAGKQLAGADFVIVNKCGRVDAIQLSAAEAIVAEHARDRPTVRAVHAAVPLSAALAMDASGTLSDPAIADSWPLPHEDGRKGGSPGHDHQHDHSQAQGRNWHVDGFQAVALDTDRSLSAIAFQRFLDEELGPAIIRGKGLVTIAETGVAYVFHLVGRRFTLDPAPELTRGTRLVLIGRGIDIENTRNSCNSAWPIRSRSQPLFADNLCYAATSAEKLHSSVVTSIENGGWVPLPCLGVGRPVIAAYTLFQF